MKLSTYDMGYSDSTEQMLHLHYLVSLASANAIASTIFRGSRRGGDLIGGVNTRWKQQFATDTPCGSRSVGDGIAGGSASLICFI